MKSSQDQDRVTQVDPCGQRRRRRRRDPQPRCLPLRRRRRKRAKKGVLFKKRKNWKKKKLPFFLLPCPSLRLTPFYIDIANTDGSSPRKDNFVIFCLFLSSTFGTKPRRFLSIFQISPKRHYCFLSPRTFLKIFKLFVYLSLVPIALEPTR